MKPENHCAICEIDYDALEEHIHKPLAPKRKPRKPTKRKPSKPKRISFYPYDDIYANDNLNGGKLAFFMGTLIGLADAKCLYAWLGKYIAWREAEYE